MRLIILAGGPAHGRVLKVPDGDGYVDIHVRASNIPALFMPPNAKPHLEMLRYWPSGAMLGHALDRQYSVFVQRDQDADRKTGDALADCMRLASELATGEIEIE